VHQQSYKTHAPPYSLSRRHCRQFRIPTELRCTPLQKSLLGRHEMRSSAAAARWCCTLLAASAYHSYMREWVLAVLSTFLSLVTLTFDLQNGRSSSRIVVQLACKVSCSCFFLPLRNPQPYKQKTNKQ